MKAQSARRAHVLLLPVDRDNFLYKLISLLLAWALVFSSLPAYATDHARDNGGHAWDLGSVPASLTSARDRLAGNAGDLHFPKRRPVARNSANPMLASLHVPLLPGKHGSDFLMNPFGPSLFSLAMQTLTYPVQVSVGFADGSSASANFPTPWQNSPNTVFVGGGTPVDAGAIRIDNTSGAPLAIDSVAVDLQRGNAQFNLWGSFTIPATGSAILTQTQPGNFDTSAFPIAPCGVCLDADLGAQRPDPQPGALRGAAEARQRR